MYWKTLTGFCALPLAEPVMAATGYSVHAGARNEADLRALDAVGNVDSIRLDVIRLDQIAGPLVQTQEEDFDFLVDVNVYGPCRISKAFSPLLNASEGRITNIESIPGTLSSRDLAACSMSKHAIEAFTDSLAASQTTP